MPSAFNYGRTSVAISKTQSNIVYALIADEQSTFQGVYRSTDFGDSFARTNDTSLYDIFSGGAHWESRITVDPANSDIVYIVGYDTYKTNDGGQSWMNITGTYHPDNHDVFVNAIDPQFLLRGNDGGLFTSHDGGFTWDHAINLPVTQFYTCETDERFPFQTAGGTQDNGVIQTLSGLPDDYMSIWGGDGFYVLVDPITSYPIMESQYGYVSLGNTGVDSLDRFNWNTPLEFNHQNTNTVFMGAQKLYRTFIDTSNYSVWSPISPDLTNHNLFGYPITWGTITTVSNAPTDSSVIYCGTDDGQVWVTQNSGTSWTNINPTSVVRWITRVTADTRNASIVYCAISGYRFHDNVAHLYRSNNFGATWQNIEGNLPDVPCNDIIPDPYRDSVLYVATDIGVYITYDLGQSWSLLGTGMPVVPVTDLRLHIPSMKLIAATYGRSLYTLDLVSVFVNTPVELSRKNSVEIFPNPSAGKFNLRLHTGKSTIASIEIFDMRGRVLYANKFEINTGSSNLNIDKNFSQGVYILSVRINEDQINSRIIIR